MTIKHGRAKRVPPSHDGDFDDLLDFFEHAPVGMHWAGADGAILRANRADYEALGYTADEYIGKDVREFFADADVIDGFLERLARGEAIEKAPARMRRKDGSIRHVVVDASALIRQGVFVHSRCVIRDDTERVRAEEQLRTNAEQSSALADLLPVLLSYVDNEHRYVYNNRAYEEWFGRARGEITGRTMEDVLGDEAWRVLSPHVEAVLAGERVTYEASVPYQDGGERWIRATYVPHRTREGVLGFVAIVEDISERVRATAAARASEERYALATRATRDAVWDLDLVANSTQWSAALMSEFGWPLEDMRTYDPWWCERVHAEERERVRTSRERAIAGDGTHWEEEYRFQHANGSWRTVLDRALILRDASGRALRMVGSMSDETDRRAAEQAVRASEARYRTLAEALPSYVGQFDSQAHASYVNNRWLELTGRSLEQMCGLGWTEVVHRQDLPGIEQELRAAAAERRAASFEYRVRAADGSWHWFLGSTAPVRGPDGEVTSWIGASADITDRKAAEMALRESERRYRELVTAIDVAIYTTDAKGLIMQFNDAAVALWGRTPRAGIDRWCGSLRLYWPDGRPMAHEESPLALTIKHGRAVRGFEAIAERPDGSRVHFIPYPTPLRDATGKLTGAVNALVDVTERKRAEKQLYAAEAQWRALTEQNPSLIVLTDEKGEAIHFNPAWKEFFALEDDQLSGWLWAEFIHPDDRDALKDDWAAAWTRGEAFTSEYRARKPSGEEHWFRGTMSPVKDQKGTITNWIAVSIDIHDQKMAGDAIGRSEERYRALAEAITSIVWTTDAEGAFVVDQPEWAAYTGQSWEEFRGWGWADAIHPDDRDEVRRLWTEALAASTPYASSGRVWHAASQSYRFFRARGLPIVENGEVREWVGTIIDVHDEVTASRAVVESEERNRTILETAVDGIVTIDEAGIIGSFNPAAERIFGYSAEEAIGRNVKMLMPETYAGGHPQYLENYLRTGVRKIIGGGRDVDARRKDGTLVPISLSVGEANIGGVRSFTGMVHDLTDRRRAEDALRESEERFRSLADTAPVLIWMSGTDKLCTYFNKPWLEFTGRSLEQEIGEGWATDVHPDDLERCARTYEEAFDRREPFEQEYRLRHHSGAYRWVLDKGVPLHSPEGTFIGYIGGCIDIDDRRRAETALAYQFGLTSTIADNASVGLMMMDRDGRITFLNPAGEMITGYRFGNVHGASAHDVLHYLHPDGSPYAAHDCPIQQANAAATMLTDYDDIFVRPDGAFYDVRCNVAPIVREDEQIGALIEIRDVTREKRAEARARFLAEASEAMNTSLEYDRMLSDMARRAVPAVADIAVVGVFGAAPETARFGTALADPSQAATVGGIHLRRWPAGDGSGRSIEQVMTSGETLLIGDAAAWIEAEAPNDEQRQLARNLGARSVICTPLTVRGEAAGMMSFAVTRGGRWYSEDDREMVAELSRRAGLALENARLYGELRETSARERLLSEARRVLGASLDESDQLSALCSLSVPQAADICVLTRFEADGRSVVHFGPAGATDDERARIGQIRLRDWRVDEDGHYMYTMLDAREAVMITDTAAWIEGGAPDDAQLAAARALKLQSLLAVPVIAQGAPIGALIWLRRQGSPAYDERDLALAEEIARRAGTSIENARLYRAVQDAAARASFLVEARARMTRSLDEGETLDAVMELLVPAMADWATVVRQQADASFELRATRYGDERYATFSNVNTVMIDAAATAGAAAAIRERRSLLFGELTDDVFEAITDAKLRAMARATPTRSALIVPVGEDSALVLVSTTPGRYTPPDVELMEAFAAHATVALSNARLYGDLQHTAADLERANATKDEFLGLVSHELKTPITTIFGNAEVLERRAGELPPEVQASALADIRVESERLHRIVDNLLVLARLEQGQQLESEPMLVRRVVARVIREHNRRFPWRRIELHHGDDLIPVLASPEYIEQVVRNLLSNAEKYSPRNQPIEVTITQEGAELCVRVLDRGQGIATSELPNVFTPFYRSPRISTAAPGAGIGLAVCKRLIEAQAGRIWAREREGGGSEFGFSVPIADDDGA